MRQLQRPNTILDPFTGYRSISAKANVLQVSSLVHRKGWLSKHKPGDLSSRWQMLSVVRKTNAVIPYSMLWFIFTTLSLVFNPKNPVTVKGSFVVTDGRLHCHDGLPLCTCTNLLARSLPTFLAKSMAIARCRMHGSRKSSAPSGCHHSRPLRVPLVDMHRFA